MSTFGANFPFGSQTPYGGPEDAFYYVSGAAISTSVASGALSVVSTAPILDLMPFIGQSDAQAPSQFVQNQRGYIDKLLDYVHDAFDKGPNSFLAMYLDGNYGLFTWQVYEKNLMLWSNGSVFETIDLTQYTLGTLANYLSGINGITVTGLTQNYQNISACALIDGVGYTDQPGGDILMAYRSTLWMYIDAMTVELANAKTAIGNMLQQMSIPTASDTWLDQWGSYFGVARILGEVDDLYGPRIIAEVIKPRGNNKAIELAILQKYGQKATVQDIAVYNTTQPTYNGAHTYNGSIHYNNSVAPEYGLFSIVVGYDILNSGDPPSFTSDIQAFLEDLRDAGTFLQSVSLASSSSPILDSIAYPSSDTEITLTTTTGYTYNGMHTYNGSISYAVTKVIQSV